MGSTLACGICERGEEREEMLPPYMEKEDKPDDENVMLRQSYTKEPKNQRPVRRLQSLR